MAQLNENEGVKKELLLLDEKETELYRTLGESPLPLFFSVYLPLSLFVALVVHDDDGGGGGGAYWFGQPLLMVVVQINCLAALSQHFLLVVVDVALGHWLGQTISSAALSHFRFAYGHVKWSFAFSFTHVQRTDHSPYNNNNQNNCSKLTKIYVKKINRSLAD